VCFLFRAFLVVLYWGANVQVLVPGTGGMGCWGPINCVSISEGSSLINSDDSFERLVYRRLHMFTATPLTKASSSLSL
jgi:hypothetical protein